MEKKVLINCQTGATTVDIAKANVSVKAHVGHIWRCDRRRKFMHEDEKPSVPDYRSLMQLDKNHQSLYLGVIF